MALLPTDPQQQKKLLAGIIALLIVFAYWYFVHGEKTKEITALESRLEQLETRNAAARARAQQGGPDLEKRLALYEEHVARLEELVPRSEEVPELLHDLTLRAQESGIDLAKMKPDQQMPGPYYTLHTYDIVVYGSYHDVGRYLASIGSLPRIVTPYNLKLQSRKETDRSGAEKLQADFRIKAYVLPSAVPAATEVNPNASS